MTFERKINPNFWPPGKVALLEAVENFMKNPQVSGFSNLSLHRKGQENILEDKNNKNQKKLYTSLFSYLEVLRLRSKIFVVTIDRIQSPGLGPKKYFLVF